MNKICVEKSIENCDIYSEDYSNTSQICLKCKDSFYLKDNLCREGKLLNCRQYDNF